MSHRPTSVRERSSIVRHAHPGADAFVGARCAARGARGRARRALAPGATRPVGAGDRRTPEEPDPFRLCFERDLDRIKHSRPWRRLAGKCQVFIAPGRRSPAHPAHARGRGRAGRDRHRARAGLCVPLTEAIALAHDCGHGPAGHASRGGVLAVRPGGYDHAVYGADVTLAPLNLCVETLDGVRNHSWRRPAPSTPEGEVVAWADRIAYVCHDFEDAVRAGILTPDDLPARDRRRRRAPAGRARSARSCARCSTRSTAPGSVGMTEPAAAALAAFRAFNFDRIYLRPAARRQAEKVDRPAARPGRLLRRRAGAAMPRASADLAPGSRRGRRGRRCATSAG